MQTLHVEITCTENGIISLSNLPIHRGDFVDVVIIPRSSSPTLVSQYALRGESLEFTDPFEPVARFRVTDSTLHL